MTFPPPTHTHTACWVCVESLSSAFSVCPSGCVCVSHSLTPLTHFLSLTPHTLCHSPTHLYILCTVCVCVTVYVCVCVCVSLHSLPLHYTLCVCVRVCVCLAHSPSTHHSPFISCPPHLHPPPLHTLCVCVCCVCGRRDVFCDLSPLPWLYPMYDRLGG